MQKGLCRFAQPFLFNVLHINHLPITAILVWDVVRRKGLFTHEEVLLWGVVREIGLFTHDTFIYSAARSRRQRKCILSDVISIPYKKIHPL